MFNDLSISNIATVIVCLLISMTVHEFMHAYVGFRLGDTTAMENGRVSFNPLRHIDPVMTILLPAISLVLFHYPFLAAKPVPFNPRNLRHGDYGAALVAAAGPLSNFAMAFLSALLLHFVTFTGFLQQGFVFFVELNVVLFVFNAIPIPPLDGSRVLYAFAPEPLQDVLERLEPFGFFIIIALVLTGSLDGIMGHLENLVLQLLP